MAESQLLINPSDNDSINTIVGDDDNNIVENYSINQIINQSSNCKPKKSRINYINLLIFFTLANLLVNIFLLIIMVNISHKIYSQDIDDFLDKLKSVVNFFCDSYKIC